MPNKVSKNDDGNIYITDENFEHFLELILDDKIKDIIAAHHYSNGNLIFKNLSETNARHLVKRAGQFAKSMVDSEGYIGFDSINLTSAQILMPLIHDLLEAGNCYGVVLVGDIKPSVVDKLFEPTQASQEKRGWFNPYYSKTRLLNVDVRSIRSIINILNNQSRLIEIEYNDLTLEHMNLLQDFLSEIAYLPFDVYRKYSFTIMWIPSDFRLIKDGDTYKRLCELEMKERDKYKRQVHCNCCGAEDDYDHESMIDYLEAQSAFYQLQTPKRLREDNNPLLENSEIETNMPSEKKAKISASVIGQIGLLSAPIAQVASHHSSTANVTSASTETKNSTPGFATS